MGSWQDGIRDPSSDLKLRIGAIFVLLVTSALGSILPIVSKRYHASQEHKANPSWAASFAPIFFDFTKYLGSGIIIATAFVHLLSPAFEELKDPSLPEAWLKYDWAPVLAMTAVFAIFTVELLAFRIGTHWLDKLGVDYDSHDHAHSAHGPCESTGGHSDDGNHFLDGDAGNTHTHEPHDYSIREDAVADSRSPLLPKRNDASKLRRPAIGQQERRFSSQRQMLYGGVNSEGQISSFRHHCKTRQHSFEARQDRPTQGQSNGQVRDEEEGRQSASQIIGVAILEFGVLLHSFVIGLTLAVVERFPTLFVVITLHQMFEGLGLGARLASLNLPRRLGWVPVAAALLFSMITPAGLAIGLAFRKTYSAESPVALIVSGILDSLSAGVLLYTGLVELLCAEFLFHQEMREAPLGRVMYALGCVVLGAAAMSVLGGFLAFIAFFARN